MAAVELTAGAAAAGPGCVVVLGASNVSRGLAGLVTRVERRAAGADLFVAAGHGRSYGAASRVWMRRLPSILRCGLWRALDRERPRWVRALVTDIGNDLLYGFPEEQVADWVRESLRRLTDRGAGVAITRLPLASIARVGPARYRALRAVFVPGCPLGLDELRAAAVRLDERLVEIAAGCGATVIDQPGSWYGLDALHVRRRHLGSLWDGACAAWGLGAGRRHRPPVAGRLALATKSAEVRSLAGVVRFTRQPVMRMRHGGRFWLY